jgi:hypothetical protein
VTGKGFLGGLAVQFLVFDDQNTHGGSPLTFLSTQNE